jgi:L-iditol 2-dehydrogenase
MMPAAIARGDGRIACEEAPAPEPAPGKVLVRMQMASICGSDLHIVYHGYPIRDYPLAPGAPGHEGVGVVADGGGTGFEPGEAVLTAPNIWSSRNFARYQLIDPGFLVRLPAGHDSAHLLMAQQLGTVLFAARKLPDLTGKTVAVIGQGSAGLFHDFVVRRLGAARVITVEPNAARREAGRALDVDETVDVTGQAAVDAVLDLTGGQGADVVVDAVGGYPTLNDAVGMVRAEGHVHVFGLPDRFGHTPFDLAGFVLKRLDMTTVFGAQDEPGIPAFHEAVRLISEGAIDMAPYVTHRFPLEQVAEAFALAHEPRDGALKVSLTIS